MPTVEQQLVERYRRSIALWKIFYGLLLTAHFVLGGASVVAPALIASNLFGSAEMVPAKVLALIAAVSASLVTFLRPSQYAQGFYSAYSLLETATDRYENGQRGGGDEDFLIDALDKARALIGAVQPSQLQLPAIDAKEHAVAG